jgi:hypothetical protein
MADIFISHIHEEAIAAEGVRRYLADFDLDAFLSSENWELRLGERWFDRITDELKAANIVILMLSPNSVARPWINFEAGWAWGQDKVTIPACFGGLEVGSMPRPYSDLQGVQLDTGHTRLVFDCYHYLKKNTLPAITGPDAASDLRNALKGIRPPLRPLPTPPV